MRPTIAAAMRALRSGAGAAGGVNHLLRRVFDGGLQPRPVADGPAAPWVTLDGVSAGYAGRWAVEQVSGRFAPGTLTAVVGPNGAGKSTLMAMLAGLTRPQSGTIRTEGTTPDAIAYLPQTAAIERSYPVSALEFAALGRWREFGAFGTPPYGLLPEVMAALQAVGLQDKATAPIGELSIGQFRRLLFARLMVQQARLVLLDEPFAAVDAQTTDDLLAVLRGWHAEGRTVIAVLHDIGQVREVFPTALLLSRRVVAWDATAAALTPDNLAAAGMGGARHDPRAGQLRLVPG
jgi:zinc/manganese transport system ATP-binding protein